MPSAASIAPTVETSRTVRRSQRSERWPSGYWMMAPPMMPTLTKVTTSVTEMPICSA